MLGSENSRGDSRIEKIRDEPRFHRSSPHSHIGPQGPEHWTSPDHELVWFPQASILAFVLEAGDRHAAVIHDEIVFACRREPVLIIRIHEERAESGRKHHPFGREERHRKMSRLARIGVAVSPHQHVECERLAGGSMEFVEVGIIYVLDEPIHGSAREHRRGLRFAVVRLALVDRLPTSEPEPHDVGDAPFCNQP